MSIQKREMPPGETFQVPFDIDVAASTLKYSFEVAGGGTVRPLRAPRNRTAGGLTYRCRQIS